MSVNKIFILGNVGKIETKSFEWGKVTTLSIATTDKGYKSKDGKEIPDKTEWHNVVLTNSLAEVAEKYVNKGDKLYIEGKIRYRSYESNGETKYITEIIGQSMEMLTPKGKQTEAAPLQQQTQAAQTPPPSDMFENQDDKDDLPF